MMIPVVHICPENDWIDHSTDMENGLCVCGPTVEIDDALMCMIIKHRRVDPEYDGPVRFWSRRRVIRFAAVVVVVVFVVWRGLFL